MNLGAAVNHPMSSPQLVREPLRSSLTAAEALKALSEERMAFALVGHWAGRGAIVGSEPLAVAGVTSAIGSSVEVAPSTRLPAD